MKQNVSPTDARPNDTLTTLASALSMARNDITIGATKIRSVCGAPGEATATL